MIITFYPTYVGVDLAFLRFIPLTDVGRPIGPAETPGFVSGTF